MEFRNGYRRIKINLEPYSAIVFKPIKMEEKMKRLLFGIALLSFVFVFSCANKSDLRKCEYTYKVNGETHTFTCCAPACPVHPDWTDVGPCQ